MSSIIEPMQRVSMDSGQLMDDHPPRFNDVNKSLVYDIAHPAGSRLTGRLGYSRWDVMELPSSFNLTDVIKKTEGRADINDYRPVPGIENASEWHVNFADPELFFGYSTGLFAQDEMQVAEHPILGSLREYLKAEGYPTSTMRYRNPTPILISGVARSCQINTDANHQLERPYGLYGNNFAIASEETVRLATRRIDPPSMSNIIAIAAPGYGMDEYTAAQISNIISTAYTGFRAAVLESGNTSVVVHTGYWGCGAFGGNRELMAILQMLAAEMAEVTRLEFHTVNQTGLETLHAAQNKIASTELGRVTTGEELITKIADMRFQWGVGNGT